MKLANMGYKKIRCVYYLQDGKVLREHLNPESIIDELDDCIVVYNPTEEQEREVLSVMEESREGEEVKVNGLKILKLMELLTDIDLGLNSGELTRKQALEIIENPSELLQAINLELNSILLNALQRQFSAAQSMNQLPEAIKKPVVEKALEQAEKEKEEKERAQREEQEELEKLEALEKELEALRQKRMNK